MNSSKFGSGSYAMNTGKISEVESELINERKELLVALNHIDAALGALQTLRGVVPLRASVLPSGELAPPTVGPPASKSLAIKAALLERPGMAPKDLQEVLEAQGIRLPHGEVYTYLHRLKARGEVHSTGKVGSRKYFVAGT